ncbi:hypothetical protein Bca52824_035581 [Brassica carinata]|uniref:Uncharacterized protein n=1 Tax=Brassica carinata TaxID=52824 RepID=A0A8X7S7U2_BRACI|nr:hypothetical protein Bca52824_035581 [Brassica carinata]
MKASTEKMESSSAQSVRKEDFGKMDESDPLFDLIPSSLMGEDPISGKPKIGKDVLDDMRLYLRAADGPERLAREERVKNSIQDIEKDPVAQKTVLRLERPATIIRYLDRGKGIVFDFSAQRDYIQHSEKLMASAIFAGTKVLQSGKIVSEIPTMMALTASPPLGFAAESQTGYCAGLSQIITSGTSVKKPRGRKRPGTFTRRATCKRILKEDAAKGQKVGEGVVTDTKRKAHEDVEPSQSSARFKKPLVVPNEGPSSI